MRRGLFAWAIAALLVASAGADEPEGGGFGVSEAPPWSEARDRLLVQIRAADATQVPNAIFRQDIPYTRTALVLVPEAPGAEAYDVTLADALAWNQTGEALFEIAFENLGRNYPPVVRETPELRPGVTVILFYNDEPYGAAYAVEVEKYPRCMGRKGALVSVPTPHAMLCYPIDSELASYGYAAMLDLSADVVAKGDQPLVPHVYWVHRGRWETQRVVLVDGGVMHGRSPAFERLLKDLEREAANPRNRRW